MEKGAITILRANQIQYPAKRHLNWKRKAAGEEGTKLPRGTARTTPDAKNECAESVLGLSH